MTEQPPPPTGDAQLAPSLQTLASDRRRDQTVELLSAACADGRLTLEDFSDRLETALQARTIPELAALEADLGVARPLPTPARPGVRAARSFVAIMSSAHGRGRLVLGPATRALAVMGEVVLDLRGAELAAGHSHIQAIAVMGSVKVVVPEGLNVELNGLALMGSKSLKGGTTLPPPEAPVIEVTAMAVMGEVAVVIKSAKPRRRRIGPFAWDSD
ncbi:MAG: DUF1707 domain-containing protein [Candidatus Dormibacteria bacterium]